MRRVALLLLATVTATACAGVHRSGPWDGAVRVDGNLRAMLHEGKTGPAVKLERLLPDGSLYAVGALAGMEGEVTVVSGKTYLAYGEEGSARIETPPLPDAAAALLVSARVPAWRIVTLEDEIPFDELDEEIGRLAAAAGLDPGTRIPFVLEGRFRDLEWHVLAGPPPAGAGADHDAHLAGASQLRLDQASGTLVGFYSAKDEGVFTHMGSKTHLHCVVPNPVASGHVDHVLVLAGTTLRFPAVAKGAQ